MTTVSFTFANNEAIETPQPHADKQSPDLPECAICLSEMKPGEKQIALKCSHVFHGRCIQGWADKLRKDERSLTCPTCRNTSSMVTTEQIAGETKWNAIKKTVLRGLKCFTKDFLDVHFIGGHLFQNVFENRSLEIY